MYEVSREASTTGVSGDLRGEPVLVGGSAGIGDLLLGNCL
jgi:hypothetical protein